MGFDISCKRNFCLPKKLTSITQSNRSQWSERRESLKPRTLDSILLPIARGANRAFGCSRLREEPDEISTIAGSRPHPSHRRGGEDSRRYYRPRYVGAELSGLHADSDEVAWAIRDDVARDYEMMSPGFGARWHQYFWQQLVASQAWFGQRSVASVSARRVDGEEIVEIEISNRLQRLAGGSVVQGGGQYLEPLRVFGL